MKINLDVKKNKKTINSGDIIIYKCNGVIGFLSFYIQSETTGDYRPYVVELEEHWIEKFEDLFEISDNDNYKYLAWYLEEREYELIEIIPSEEIEIRRISNNNTII